MFFVSHRRLVARCLKHPCLVQWYIRVGTMQVRPCWYNVSTSMLVQCKYLHCWYNASTFMLVCEPRMRNRIVNQHGGNENLHSWCPSLLLCETHWEFNIHKFFSGWPNYCNDLELTLPPTTNPCFTAFFTKYWNVERYSSCPTDWIGDFPWLPFASVSKRVLMRTLSYRN